MKKNTSSLMKGAMRALNLSMILALLGLSVNAIFQIRSLTALGLYQIGTIEALAWSPDGNTLAVGSRSGVQLYDSQLNLVTSIDIDFSLGLAWSPDGEMLAIGYYDESFKLDEFDPVGGTGVQIWDVNSSSIAVTLPSQRTDYLYLAWNPDNTQLAVSTFVVNIWSIPDGQLTATYDRGFITADIDWNADGSLLGCVDISA
ncbi:MAG: hypothetical protein K8I82_11790 [Anaerolineae bacterium]|nr:hypothetical protein [Anaerolineae bacterium]